MVMGRPKSEEPKTRAIQIRLTPGEQEVFDRLLSAFEEDAHGVRITPPALIRALIMKEARERGLDKPAPGPSGGALASRPSRRAVPGQNTRKTPGPGRHKKGGDR